MKSILLIISLSTIAMCCSNDYQCSYGNKCVKSPYSMQGTCMEVVNEYGMKDYSYTPSSESMNIKTKGDCDYDTDCAIGFKCSNKYKVCIKR